MQNKLTHWVGLTKTNIQYTIKQYANKIKKIMNYEGEIIWDSSKPDGTPRKLLDSSLAKKYGWKANVSLEDRIGFAINDFIKNFIQNDIK